MRRFSRASAALALALALALLAPSLAPAAVVVNTATAVKNAQLDAMTALINTGGAGTIEIYDGTMPAGPATAVTTQVKLVTLTFSATAFGSASSNVSTANSITAGTAIATGTPTWARIKNGSGTAIIDVSVGTSGAFLNLASSTISTGNTVSITSMTFSMP